MGVSKDLFISMQEALVDTIERTENGYINHLDAVIELRKQKSFHEEMLKSISEFESENYNEIELQAKDYDNKYKGVKFEFRNGRKTFDFSKIEEVKIADANLKEIKKKYQTAWDSVQKGITPVDDSTGEILQVPIMSQGKSVMVVKIPF